MDQVAAQFTGLLVSFPAQAISDTAAKAKAQAYFIALEGLPAWAVQEACRRWLRGEPGPNKDANFAFAPSAPQLRILADSLTADLRMHRLKMRRILDAKVRVELPEADRARMVQRLRDVIAPHTNEGSA
ncbi:hypothetical protein [Aquabacter sp. CN5-332]|uniref:hypothetical protein n=1 Tax=Aquabacter sp. CN5-332 TaxID=3156608 RepID=UPI0032B361A1